MSRLITVAIHTYDQAQALKSRLEKEGVECTLQNVNLDNPVVAAGVRVRIHESDLPLALRVIENTVAIKSGDNEEGNERYILVPVDFSEHSVKAACVAVTLAHAHNAVITLLHSFIDPAMGGNLQLTEMLTYDMADSSARKQLHETASTGMRHFVARLKKMMAEGTLPEVSIETRVVEGVPEDAIIEYAKLAPPLFVTMGTRGVDRKEKEIIGSVTAEVLDECRFPVLTIPETADPCRMLGLRKVLFIGNTDQEDILAMDAVYRLFPTARPEVMVANIASRKRTFDKMQSRSRKSLLDYFIANFARFRFETVDVQADKAVDDFTAIENSSNVDMIVLPGKRKNALSRLFNPSLAHKILFRADIPMFVIPV